MLGYNPFGQAQVENLIHVQSEMQARDWPIAQVPGNTVKFTDDNAPYCYVKTYTGSVQQPIMFKKVKQVVEEDQSKPTEAPADAKEVDYVTKDDLEPFKQELEKLSNDRSSLYLTKEDFEPFEKKLEDVYNRLEKLKELTD